MKNWTLTLIFHWPHDRFSFGWEVINPSPAFNYRTISLFLGIITLNLDIEE